MISWLLLVLRTLTGMARSRASLTAENAVLRHKLAVSDSKYPENLRGWSFRGVRVECLRPADSFCRE